MSYLKHFPIKSGTHILNSIKYVEDEKKVSKEYITGINCDVKRVDQDFEFAKIIHEKTNPKIIAHHYIQSFKPGEANEKIANEIGCRLINEIAPGYQAIVVTHNDTKHLHNHIIINSVNINTGYMYKANRESYRNALSVKDKLDREYGLSVLDKYNTQNKGIDKSTYHLALKGKSWKVKMLNVIDEAVEFSRSKEEFINYIQKQGYQVKYNNKNISIKDPNEQIKFIRVDTLGRQFGENYFMKSIEARLNKDNLNIMKGENELSGRNYNRRDEKEKSNRNREIDYRDTGGNKGNEENGTVYKNYPGEDIRRNKRKGYTTEQERYAKWKSEQERNIKEGISLDSIDNQLFKIGTVLGSISDNKNRDSAKEETLKVFIAIAILFLRVRKKIKFKKANKLRYRVKRIKNNLKIGNASYEELKKIPGENKYMKLNVDELEKLKNQANFNYTGIIKDNKITIMFKDNDLENVLDVVGRKYEKQYGNTTYKYIKEHCDKIEFRLIDNNRLQRLKESNLKFACFKKGDKFNVAFGNQDLSKYIELVKNLKEKER